MVRGMVNLNPFNIEKNNIEWQGMIKPGSDPTFVQFSDIKYGLRAGFMCIKNMISEGYNTINKLIPHYAPPSENNTTQYIANVVYRTKIDPNKVLNSSDIKELGISIILNEVGTTYSDAQINQALIDSGVLQA